MGTWNSSGAATMITTKMKRLDVVPSADPDIFHLVDAGNYIGSIACDGGNVTASRPWGWRLVASDGTAASFAGRSADFNGALAAAERAYATHAENPQKSWPAKAAPWKAKRVPSSTGGNVPTAEKPLKRRLD